jgi:uncharacterized membrane protein YsdA (DUF1294 family)
VLGCPVHVLCFLSLPAQILAVWLSIANLAGLIMMGYDKAQAEASGRRVREMTLWKIAFIGGAFGVLAGESAFHHKTQDLTFMAPIYLATGIWLWLVAKIVGTG